MGNSYLPLFRKYRPQSFDDVIGQDALVKALSNAIELNRIANAYLFAVREEQEKLPAHEFLRNL